MFLISKENDTKNGIQNQFATGEKKPVTLPVLPASIPQALKILPQWVTWKYVWSDKRKAWTKPPYQWNGQFAKSNDPSTWHGFDTPPTGYDGIGLVLSVSDGLTGLDLDHVLNPKTGELDPLAIEVLKHFNGTYTEISPSGEGIRIWCYGKPQRSGKCVGTRKWLEVYSHPSNRYLTVTGNQYGTVNAVTNQQAALDWIHDRFMDSTEKEGTGSLLPVEIIKRAHGDDHSSADLALVEGKNKGDSTERGATMATVRPLSSPVESPFDSDAALLDRARRAANGTQFSALYSGDMSSCGGDHSSADLALCNLLAFWTGKDANRIDRLFRQSGLMRPKWDEKHHSDGRTYGQGTIDKAIAGCREVFSFQSKAPKVDFEALLSNTSEEPLFKRVSLADVLTNPPAPQRYVWGERLPFDALSLLAAHGGTGKSLFALQLAAHTAVGKPFLGLPTEQIKTLFFSAEDGTNTIRRRFAAICQDCDLDPEQVERNLVVLDATNAPCLFHEVNSGGGVRTGEPTVHYHGLRKTIEAENVGFLIVDNASDSFGANPIDRQAVTKFIRALVRLVRDAGGAVLLLSHVNKNTSRAGAKQSNSESYADGAAWHNAARSRLFLNATDQGELTLAHQKNNYGKKQPVFNIAFREGGSSLFAVDAADAGAAGAAGAVHILRKAARLPVLKMIQEYYKREEWISPSKQSNASNAYAMLHDDADYPQALTKSDCLAMLRESERDGLLKKESYRKLDRHPGERWQLTAQGRKFIGEPLPQEESEEVTESGESFSPCF